LVPKITRTGNDQEADEKLAPLEFGSDSTVCEKAVANQHG